MRRQLGLYEQWANAIGAGDSDEAPVRAPS
jgi:hypothetical protein